jgi:predicted  nucleic acid-binding Zn-ribbon protein
MKQPPDETHQLFSKIKLYFCFIFMLMPVPELTESDLKSYLDKLSDSSSFSSVTLTELSFMYTRFKSNEQNLIALKYGLDRIRIENEYLEKKKQSQNKLADLKKQYKQVDNRITSVEQKLSRGIPEDMDIVEKLITEQEAIVQEQQKLNAAESALAAQVSNIDIAYGKARERLMQNRTSSLAPLPSKFEAYAVKLDKTDQQLKTRTSMYAIIPLIGIPLLLEFLLGKIGIPLIISTKISHSAAMHYLFFAGLILTEFFLAGRIRNMIYGFSGIRHTKASAAELSRLLSENLQETAALEKSSGMKLQQVIMQTENLE